MKNEKLTPMFLAVMLAIAAPGLASCDDDPDTLGEAIDEAGDELEDAVD